MVREDSTTNRCGQARPHGGRITLWAALGCCFLVACATDEPTLPALTPTLTITPPRGSTSTEFQFEVSLGAKTNNPSGLFDARWDWDGDGDWDTDFEPATRRSYRYATPGIRNARCELSVVGGLSGIATEPLTVSRTGWSDEFGAPPSGAGTNATVYALESYQGQLAAAGAFTQAGNVAATRVGLYDGASWHTLGSGTNASVLALIEFEGDLIAGGGFTTAGASDALRVARWDGSAWRAMGAGFNGDVWAFAIYRGDLYAAGVFSSSGVSFVNRVARWDGSAWRDLGSGFDFGAYTLAVYNDRLYVGGTLEATVVDGAFLQYYDGTSWHHVSDPPSDIVIALRPNDTSLFVGGRFLKVGTLTVNRIARWDGTLWHSLNEGLDGTVNALATYAGDLIALGLFQTASGVTLKGVGRWNGSQWRAMGTGVGGTLNAEPWWGIEIDDRLWIGGLFLTAGDLNSSFLARWED